MHGQVKQSVFFVSLLCRRGSDEHDSDAGPQKCLRAQPAADKRLVRHQEQTAKRNRLDVVFDLETKKLTLPRQAQDA